jgi:hypothetical protein
MLWIQSLSPAQQRELHDWQSSDDLLLARRAQFVLWSARGWSVPALARVVGSSDLQAGLSLVEKGRKKPKTDILSAIRPRHMQSAIVPRHSLPNS